MLAIDNRDSDFAVIKEMLSYQFQVSEVCSGLDALQFLEETEPDLIFLDPETPDMDGEAFIRLMRENYKFRYVPVILLLRDAAAEEACAEWDVDDVIVKPFFPATVKRRAARALEMVQLRRDIKRCTEDAKIKTEQVTLNSITSIANTIDAKDRYTSGHSVRVAECAVEIARRLGWTEEELKNLHYVALLHDIGKIGVPDSILNKPTKLTEQEFSEIKKHPVTGAEILKDIHTIDHVEEAALFHHERYDGTGYPFGLKGADIPLYARIVGIADAYDAMTSNRVYRKHLSMDEVIKEFERCSGSQFDPEITEIFIEMLKGGFSVQDTDTVGGNDIMGESNALLHKVLTEYTMEAKKRSMTDALTGIYNREYAEGRVGELIRNGHTGALFMMDLDNFKQVNDTFGHIVGDQTLQMFADILQDHAGEEDVICRLGGDEFVVFFTDISQERDAAKKAESIILSFQRHFRKFKYYNETTSISIGIAFVTEKCNDFQSLYRNADKALYYIKNNGKDAYHFYSRKREKADIRNTLIDLKNVRRMIEGELNESVHGAFSVAYDKFQKIYDFIARCIERRYQMVQTILLTLRADNDDYPDTEALERAMNALETAVITSLRIADVGTRYSSSQYIVLLLDASTDNGKMVAERVRNRFYDINTEPGVVLTYDIQMMQPKGKQEEK